MPTGYTSEIAQGKEMTRNDFIMRCARAFGALIMMRDEPLDAQVPERFEPSTYSRDNLERAKQQLEHYKAMSAEQGKVEMEQEYQEELNKYEQTVKREEELRQRYQTLLDKVKTWNPPTQDHAELKSFCIKQLEDSIANDCGFKEYAQKPQPQEFEEWLNYKISFAVREIAYYEKDWNEEVKRTENRNSWLKLLRESL